MSHIISIYVYKIPLALRLSHDVTWYAIISLLSVNKHQTQILFSLFFLLHQSSHKHYKVSNNLLVLVIRKWWKKLTCCGTWYWSLPLTEWYESHRLRVEKHTYHSLLGICQSSCSTDTDVDFRSHWHGTPVYYFFQTCSAERAQCSIEQSS